MSTTSTLPTNPTGLSVSWGGAVIGTVAGLQHYGAGAPVLYVTGLDDKEILIPYSASTIASATATTLTLAPFAESFLTLNVTKPAKPKAQRTPPKPKTPKSVMKTILTTLLFTLFSICTASLGMAAETMHPGGFPAPASGVAAEIGHLYNIIFIIISVIFFIVLVPIGIIALRFRRSQVAKPATFSHSTLLEVSWTVIPAIICIFIAYESWLAMRTLRTMPEGAINIEAVAYQFGWDFYYPDASENGVHVKASAPTAPDAEVSAAGVERIIPTMVVPVNKPIVMHVTGADVIHAFFVPKLGVKIDAIPGRINYAWFSANQTGNFLGQCAELCGSAHGEMFFRVKVVEQAEYDAYIAAQRTAAGLTPTPVVATTSPTVVVSDTIAITPTTTVTATTPASPTIPPSPTNP